MLLSPNQNLAVLWNAIKPNPELDSSKIRAEHPKHLLRGEPRIPLGVHPDRLPDQLHAEVGRQDPGEGGIGEGGGDEDHLLRDVVEEGQQENLGHGRVAGVERCDAVLPGLVQLP